MSFHNVSLADIEFIQKLGNCDTGSVYLATLKCSSEMTNKHMLAAKFMDKKAQMEGRNKEGRARTEREILEMLDHPFLPKLHGVMENERWLCLLTEFCEGGDLHVLRQRQVAKRFSEDAVRFYASEIIIAIEYLHLLGIIYRDLKPENVLVRSDGHIMLTDFDLSLKSIGENSPDVQLIPNPNLLAVRNSLRYSPFLKSFCMLPKYNVAAAIACLQSKRKRRKKHRSHNGKTYEFVAEPVDLRSMSFVGTHEYLAPEIIAGNGHGSAVDWWTLGIFMYELLYGFTPFRGSENEHTLANIMACALEFPKDPSVSTSTKDLISGLLNKDPAKRTGSTTGASAIKCHPCFDRVNWALLRSTSPPYIPPPFSVCSSAEMSEDDSDSDTLIEYY